MEENSSLMNSFDEELVHNETEISPMDDVEKARPSINTRPRRWIHSRIFQRNTLLWALPLILGISILFYTWDTLALSQRALRMLSAKQQEDESYSEPIHEQNTTEKIGVKPSDVTVIGVVFFGRRQYVDILDCYLQRNLALNGGYLNEVHFLSHSSKREDIDWVQSLINRTAGYKYVETEGHYGTVWKQHASDPNTLYIKMDDDITYIHDNAIPRMVHTLIDHPESYAVSANVINSPEGHWLHYHTNAIVPYLPEPHEPDLPLTPELTSWRPSKLPEYPQVPIPDHFDMKKGPSRDHHRWLPLDRNSKNLHKTPIHAAAYEWQGIGVTSWSLAAQQHASLLSNIEADTLNRYYFGDEIGVWNMQNYRYSINFLALWGSTVRASEISARDELDIAVKNPERLGRPLLVDSHALVAHFSFGPQQEHLLKTDFLDRYRSYANEMVCRPENQKVPFQTGS
ncbi:MAG: hypothetical protein Q9157_004960 [Trypethelium eluteriae]